MLYKLFVLALFAMNASLVMGQSWIPRKEAPDAISAVFPNKKSLPSSTQQKSVNGYLTLSILEDEYHDTRVKIIGKIKGLKPKKKYGFHIHEFGNIYKTEKEDHSLDLPPTVDCGQTGKHYNPFKQNHGGLDSHQRHVGDLGNIEANGHGIATVDIITELKLDGDISVLGRAFVIHEGEDDEGATEDPTGGSGGRLACGSINIYGEIKPKKRVLKPAYIGCYNNADIDDFISVHGTDFTIKTCAKACAAKNVQYFGVQKQSKDKKGLCACFKGLKDATANERHYGNECERTGRNKKAYDLYFDPTIHAKTKDGLMTAKFNHKCVKADGKDVVLGECNGNIDERWIYTDDKRIMNYNGKCLGVGKHYEQDGAVIVQVQLCHDKTKTPAGQQWKLIKEQIKNVLFSTWEEDKCIANIPQWSSDKTGKPKQIILFDCDQKFAIDYNGIMQEKRW